MKHFKAYCKENSRFLAAFFLLALIMAATMRLNAVPLREIGYGLLLCIFVMAIAVFAGYAKHLESFRQLEQMKKNITIDPNDLKTPEYMYEMQYQDCIRTLAREKNALQNEMTNRQQAISEYYSMWVHQIKTPIAALKLLIDEEMTAYLDVADTENNSPHLKHERQKQQELFRIEQYVDMALQYTRLEAKTNDFVIQNVMLDEVIKLSIHKYAPLFIHKKLRLTYVPQDITAITDKKWLGFVIDQLLSNAIKYTKQGGITIQTLPLAWENPRETDHAAWFEKTNKSLTTGARIRIEDTGIGILAEDLPRICEKGYTGYNGHADKYSSGIGLYLCREILDKLGHTLVITSEQEKGTSVEIVLANVDLQNCK